MGWQQALEVAAGLHASILTEVDSKQQVLSADVASTKCPRNGLHSIPTNLTPPQLYVALGVPHALWILVL